MRDHQRTQRVIGDDAAGVADDVRVSCFEPQRANGKPRIHARQDGDLARGTRRQIGSVRACARILRLLRDTSSITLIGESV